MLLKLRKLIVNMRVGLLVSFTQYNINYYKTANFAEIDGMMADRPAKLHCSVGSANPMPDVHWQFISMNGKIDEKEGEYRKRPLKP